MSGENLLESMGQLDPSINLCSEKLAEKKRTKPDNFPGQMIVQIPHYQIKPIPYLCKT